MGSKERREREKENLRQEILDAARDLFVSEGYENVSMRKIAERIEYSPTTIYLYFEDKAAIFESLCDESFAKLVERQEALARKHRDPLIRLRECGRAYIHFGLEHPNHYRVAFMQPQDVGDARAFEDSMGFKAFNFLRTTVEECVREKKFRRVDVDIASQAIWAATHGLTSLLITHTGFPWVEREKLIDFMLHNMLESLKP
ncbi:MAG: TetR/AcrR family transcriptional regulator [Blastocatellia bacterium]|nr:TetR/AcrR family transcriptional regulator [Blastocatellia bacterium]